MYIYKPIPACTTKSRKSFYKLRAKMKNESKENKTLVNSTEEKLTNKTKQKTS